MAPAPTAAPLSRNDGGPSVARTGRCLPRSSPSGVGRAASCAARACSHGPRCGRRRAATTALCYRPIGRADRTAPLPAATGGQTITVAGWRAANWAPRRRSMRRGAASARRWKSGRPSLAMGGMRRRTRRSRGSQLERAPAVVIGSGLSLDLPCLLALARAAGSRTCRRGWGTRRSTTMRYVHHVPRLDAAAKLTASFGRCRRRVKTGPPAPVENWTT